MGKRMLLILNPCAGKRRLKNQLFNLVKVFSQNGYEVTVNPTQRRFDATQIVRESGQDFDIIVCCGGDGTLNEVLTGMMDLPVKPQLGYIAAGTTNDLANSLKLPKKTIKAARAIIDGKPFRFDIGSLGDRYFGYIAAFGAFTEVSYETPQEAKNTLGHLAYILEAFKHLKLIRPYHLIIEHDGVVTEGDYIFGSVTNSMSVAGIVKLNPNDVKLGDGLFEVFLIRDPKNAVRMNRLISGILKQKYDDQYVTFFHTAKVTITCEEEIAWCLDGENGGIHKSVEVINNHAVVEFLC